MNAALTMIWLVITGLTMLISLGNAIWETMVAHSTLEKARKSTHAETEKTISEGSYLGDYLREYRGHRRQAVYSYALFFVAFAWPLLLMGLLVYAIAALTVAAKPLVVEQIEYDKADEEPKGVLVMTDREYASLRSELPAISAKAQVHKVQDEAVVVMDKGRTRAVRNFN